MIKKLITFFIIFWYFFIFSWEIYSDKNSLNENLFQESINKYFKPIDEKAENYLRNLNISKNYCFGPEKKMDFTECADNIEKVFSINSDELVMGEDGYAEACEKAFSETVAKQKNKEILAKEAQVVLEKNYWNKSCTELYISKLDIFKSVAYDILKKNKYAVLRDEHKKYTQKIRTNYSNLLELIRINIWYIERLWKKWPSKTKK